MWNPIQLLGAMILIPTLICGLFVLTNDFRR